MRDKNKIVIFDWGGVVESHREGEYNVFNARTDIIKSLIGNKLSENAITKNGMNAIMMKIINVFQKYIKKKIYKNGLNE